MKTGFCFFITLILLNISQLKAESDLQVLVSNKAFHSLVSAVMDGVSKPLLLLKGNISPHSYALRPSAAENLQKADIVFWGGEILEGFLVKPIQTLAKKAKLVSLHETDGLTLLPLREVKKWHKPESETLVEKSTKKFTKKKSATDPHIWLDPNNAKVITQKIAQILSEMDPVNEKRYSLNAEKNRLQIDLLDQKLKEEMEGISTVAYIVFHDAYQYFERHYQLNSIGSVVSNTGQGKSVRRMVEVRKIIKKEKIRCIFIEPQFPSKLVKTVIEGTSVKTGTLDPLGAGLKPGKELYFNLLINLSNSLRNCLY